MRSNQCSLRNVKALEHLLFVQCSLERVKRCKRLVNRWQQVESKKVDNDIRKDATRRSSNSVEAKRAKQGQTLKGKDVNI